MDYIVIDMEWNQPFSYRTTIKEPVYLTGEIIQLGAVKLNASFRAVDRFSADIAPQYYTQMNPMVQELTHLTDFDLRHGRPFPEVFSAFSAWCGEEFVLIMWGDNDAQVLKDNMLLHGLDTSGFPKAYNLQSVFSKQILHDQRRINLTSALEMVSRKSFDAHNALADAEATAEICRHLDMKKGISEYSATIFGTADGCVEQAVFEDAYMSVDEALDDDYVVSFLCPHCGELVWCDGLVSKKKRRLIGLCRCEEDGEEFLIRLKFRSTDYGMMRVHRSVYALTDELFEEYCYTEDAAAAV